MNPIALVPHTHWDREWYLTFEEFRGRLVATMDAVLSGLRSDERWTHFHLDGQTAMVDDYLSLRPEMEESIRELVGAGRLSCGPWVTLVDEFSVSGESIVRNLEDGLTRAEVLGGPLLIGYLPDQFGHVGQMPQLLASVGIDVAVVWRGVPAAVQGSGFVWRAPDGSSVRAFYLPFGYGQGARLPTEAAPFVDRLRAELEGLAPFFAPGETALLMAGDDYEFPNAQLPELIAAARRGGIDVEIMGLDAYLSGWSTPAATCNGELRSAARANLLPNTYSVRAHQKVARARAEHLLERYAEPLAALVPGERWPRSELDEAWGLLHLNGAHDSVCGCSSDEVAHAVDARTERAADLARAITARSLTRLAASAGAAGTLVFNPSPFERLGIPGLGWRVVGERAERAPVPLRADRGRLVAAGPGWEALVGFEDQGDCGDLYTFCPDGVVRAPTSVTSDGDVARISFDGFDATVRAWRGPQEGFVRFQCEIDNRRPDHRIRAVLDLPEAATGTAAASAFEIVHRPPVGEGGASEPPPVVWPARGFVVAGATGFLSEGVIEYELVSERRLALTLLRCVGVISRAELPTRRVTAGPPVPTPEAQMLGRHRVDFGVLVTDPGERLVHQWERYSLDLLEAPASGGGPSGAEGCLLELDVPALSSLRARGRDVVVRVWNPWARPVAARVGPRAVEIGPHRIETVTLSRGAGS